MLDEKLKDFENLENIFADEFTENQKSRNLSISQKLDKLLEQTESKRSTKKELIRSYYINKVIKKLLLTQITTYKHVATNIN